MASFSASCNSLRRDGRTVYVNVYCSASSGYYGKVWVNGSQKSTWTNANGGSYSGTTTLSWDCPGPFSSRSIECRFQYYDSRGGRTQNSYQYPTTGSLGARTYTISYNKGSNGTGTNTSDTKTYDVSLTLKGEIFTRQGYTQTGWSTSDGGAKAYDLSESYTTNADATLYPYWEKNGFNIYPTSGGTIEQVSEICYVQSGTVQQISDVYIVENGVVTHI